MHAGEMLEKEFRIVAQEREKEGGQKTVDEYSEG